MVPSRRTHASKSGVAGFLAFALLLASATAPAPAHSGDGEIRTFSDLNGKRIGLLTGTMFEYVLNSSLDYTQLFYYSELDQMIAALLAGELDCFVDDVPVLRYVASKTPRLRVFDTELFENPYAFGLSRRDTGLYEAFDGELRSLIESGGAARIIDKWLRDGENGDPPPETAPGGRTLRLGVYAEAPPFVFTNPSGDIVGIDVELAAAVCGRLGWKLDIVPMGFDALFDAIGEETVDVIAAGISVTEDRKRLVAFSTPYYRGGMAVAVAAAPAAGND